MKYIALLALLCATPLHAQTDVSLYDGMYSKEWEQERDALNNDKQHPAAAEKDAKHWNMNGGLHPEMTPSGTTSGYKRKSSGTRGTTGTRSSSYSSEFLERRREAVAQAREEAERKERERKERIARENAEDFRNGYATKMASSAAYYGEKHANDEYKMGEGARLLDESVRASDYATPPEVRPESYSVSEENELFDIMQKGMDTPSRLKLHVDTDGHYNTRVDASVISQKVDEARAQAVSRRQQTDEAKLKVKGHLERLRKSNFDFSALAAIFSKAGAAANDDTPKNSTATPQPQAADEGSKPDSALPRKQRTYEEYLYLLDRNKTDDFTDEDWDIFSQMVAEKDKQIDNESEKMKQQNKGQ